MDLTETPEQRMLRESAARLFAEPGDPWPRMAAAGFLGLLRPEAEGGAGLDLAHAAVVLREAGRARAATPFIPSVVLAMELVAAAGSPDQRAALLPDAAAGRIRLAAAWLDAPRRPARATRHGAGVELFGAKTGAVGAPGADLLIVPARMGRETALFLVPPGPRLRARPSLAGLPIGELDLDGLALGAEARLGGGDAEEALAAALDAAAAAACAEAAGTMSWLLETTAAYLRTREQFGRPLAAFQVLQHRLARMAVAVEEAEAIALYACLAPPHRRARAAASAKAKVGRAARFVAQQAVQLHGGMGVTEELPVGEAFRRLMAFEMLYGTTAEQAARTARFALEATEGVLG